MQITHPVLATLVFVLCAGTVVRVLFLACFSVSRKPALAKPVASLWGALLNCRWYDVPGLSHEQAVQVLSRPFYEIGDIPKELLPEWYPRSPDNNKALIAANCRRTELLYKIRNY